MNVSFTSTITGTNNQAIETFYGIKRYSRSEKIGKFYRLFLQTFCSLGIALVFPNFRHRWYKLLFLNESRKQILDITRVSINPEKTFQKSTEELSEIQIELNKRGIPLNCANPPFPKNRNDCNKAAIQDYLNYLKETHQDKRYELVKAFWEIGVDKITLETLEEHLFACVNYLDTLLHHDYDIGFVAGKSTKWIAELAIPYLSKLPTNHFEHSSDVGGHQSKLKGDRFVIFDDASYSGKQLKTLITSMESELENQGKKRELYLVIPFISSISERHLAHHLAKRLEAKCSKKLKVHLITSNRKIKTMADLDPTSHNSDGITFTEWKIPDTSSLSSAVRGTMIEDKKGTRILEFLTNYPPCYKHS